MGFKWQDFLPHSLVRVRVVSRLSPSVCFLFLIKEGFHWGCSVRGTELQWGCCWWNGGPQKPSCSTAHPCRRGVRRCPEVLSSAMSGLGSQPAHAGLPAVAQPHASPGRSCYPCSLGCCNISVIPGCCPGVWVRKRLLLISARQKRALSFTALSPCRKESPRINQLSSADQQTPCIFSAFIALQLT